MRINVLVQNIINISHLELVLAYCYYVCEHYESVTLFISTNDKMWNKKIIGKDTFTHYILPSNLDIKFEVDNNILRKYPLYICNFGRMQVSNYQMAKKFETFKKFVIFDEGSGSWQHFLILLINGIKEKKRMKRPFMKYILRMSVSWILHKGLKKDFEIWTWLKEGEINTTFLDYLKKVYASKKDNFNRVTMPTISSKSWIILTSPLVEMGYMLKDEYINWFNNILHKIEKENNQIFIKCHPAEDTSKYETFFSKNVTILKETESIESMLYPTQYHQVNVIGEFSTSLVTLNMLYGINTYGVESLVDVKISGDFKRLFSQHVKPLDMKVSIHEK